MIIPEAGVKQDRITHDNSADKADINFPANADRLSQFPRWKFFSPAMLYLCGGFTDEHLAQFQYAVNREVPYAMAKFKRPLFEGLVDSAGNAGWNHTLWAVEADLWPAFESFMLSVVISDSPLRRLYRVGAQDGQIVDPLWAEKHLWMPRAVSPVLNLVMFGVDGNRAAVAMAFPRSWRSASLPRLAILPPRDRTKRMSKALFSEQMELPDVADLMIPPPVDTLPVHLRTQDINSLPTDRQQEYKDAADEYRKMTP